MATKEQFDVVGNVMAYEAGDLDDMDTLKLFGELIRTRTAWSLQGHYGRQAMALIEAGLIEDETGKVNWETYHELTMGGEYA